MSKNLGWIRNPLTIIGIFSTLTEGLALVILPHVTERNQNVFIWFATVFPLCLLFLFFHTLIKHNTKLYAPTDFSEDRLEFAAMFLNKNLSNAQANTPILNEPNDLLISATTTTTTTLPPPPAGTPAEFRYFGFPQNEHLDGVEERIIMGLGLVRGFLTKVESLLDSEKLESVTFISNNPYFCTIAVKVKPEYEIIIDIYTFVIWLTEAGENKLKMVLVGAGGEANDQANFILHMNKTIDVITK